MTRDRYEETGQRQCWNPTESPPEMLEALRTLPDAFGARDVPEYRYGVRFKASDGVAVPRELPLQRQLRGGVIVMAAVNGPGSTARRRPSQLGSIQTPTSGVGDDIDAGRPSGALLWSQYPRRLCLSWQLCSMLTEQVAKRQPGRAKVHGGDSC